MKDFFLEKFEQDFLLTRSMINFIDEQEDAVTQSALKITAHILNAHHIWIKRLKQETAESGFWDLPPLHFFHRLNEFNHTETMDFIELSMQDTKCYWDNETEVIEAKLKQDVLFHLLTHAAHHRGQIILELKLNNLNYPQVEMVSFT